MRVQGSTGVLPLECINIYKNKWRVRWDVQTNIGVDDIGIDRSGVNYEEAEFLHKPSLDEIKKVVFDWHNSKVDNKIREEFVWNNMAVWLSSENQFNYKASYDLAIQTSGASLPVTFKFGSSDCPIYKEFDDLTDLTDFYVKAMAFVNLTLAEGWKKKDSIDWSIYEQ